MINNYNNTTEENELARMRQLMGYGLNENKNASGNSNVAFHQVGPDGNTYGIIKECNKFYIKVAPKKDTEILAEDYDYIGGFMNKKEYEYPTYTIASKQFGLKMKSLNEAYASKDKKSIVMDKPIEPAEWQINETKEMRSEIDRFNQLMNNVDYILSEGKEYEGKALQLGSKTVDTEGGNAYQEKPTSEKEVNNMKENETNPKEADDTFNEKPMSVKEVNNMKETAKDHTKADDTYSKPAPKTFKLTNEQIEKVLAWNKDAQYMDKSHGTEIGHDGDPYTEKGEVTNEAIYNSEDMNQHTGDAEEYMEPFDNNVNETIEIDSETGLPSEEGAGEMLVDDEDLDASVDDFEPVQGEIANDYDELDDFEGNDMLPDEVLDYETRDDMDSVLESLVSRIVKSCISESLETPKEDELPYYDEDDSDYERLKNAGWAEVVNTTDPEPRDARKPLVVNKGKVSRMNEDTLDDFGKHPAWHKEPMTTPANTEPSKFGHEWDDDSAKGEQPYGTKILHGGDPYTERVIDMLTDSVMDKLISEMTSKKKV